MTTNQLLNAVYIRQQYPIQLSNAKS